MITQRHITLPAFPRGFHLITDLVREALPELPETGPYVHTIEGPDDMPAHVKSTLAGSRQTTSRHMARHIFVRIQKQRREPQIGIDRLFVILKK